jgi:hypothetical protein
VKISGRQKAAAKPSTRSMSAGSDQSFLRRVKQRIVSQTKRRGGMVSAAPQLLNSLVQG